LLDIGENVFIAGEVVLHTHNPGSWIVKPDGSEIWGFGKIKIEDDCIIGTRVQVMHNVRIGRNSIVGAGSVVISDVPPNSVIMGVPARVMGSSLTYKEKALALWQSQIPPGWRNIPANRKVEKMKNHLLYMFGNYKDGELPKT
jgi:serine acetyltransferase